jgi:hypothetical protein
MVAARKNPNTAASGRILKGAVGALLVLVMLAPAVDAIGFRTQASASTSAPATSLTLTPPIGGADGTQAADVMLAALAFRGDESNVTAPDGWTLVDTLSGTGSCPTNTAVTPALTQCIYWKAAAALEGPSTWTFEEALMASGGIAVYSAVDSETPFLASQVAGQSNGITPLFTVPSPGVDTNQANQRVVSFFAIAAQTSFTPPASSSERFDRATTTSTPSVTVEASDFTQTTATTSTTTTTPRTATAGAAAVSVAATLALRQPTVSFAIDNSSVEEGDVANLVVEISGRSGQATTFNYARTAGTATNTDDFTPFSGSASIPANTDSVTIPITTVDDTADEANEWVNITLSGPSNALLAQPVTHTLTILDNDNPTVSLSVPDGNATETGLLEDGDDGVFRLTRTAPLDLAVTVNYAFSGTGAADSFTPSGGGAGMTSATIPAGQATLNITISLDDDLDPEATNVLNLTLLEASDGEYELGDNVTGSMNLISNDGSSISIQPTASGPEGDFSTDNSTLTMEVYVTPTDTSNTLTVDYRTVNGTAIGGEDYVNQTGTLVFPPGSGSLLTPGVITIDLLEDFTYEPDESFTIVLSNPQYGQIAGLPGETGTSTLTIEAGDEPVVSFNASATSILESDGPLELTLVVTPTPDTAFTVDYQTFAGTANGGTVGQGLTRDYVTKSGTVSFAPGDTNKTVSITVNNDAIDEQTETFEVVLTGTSAAARLADNSTMTVSIVDDDDPVFAVIAGPAGSEPDGLANFTITRAGSALDLNVTVFYAIDDVNDTATKGDDYTIEGTEGQVFLPSGTASVNVTLQVVDDPEDELTETVILVLQDGATYNLSAEQSNATLEVLDDDDPTVTVVTEAVGDDNATEAGDEGRITVSRAGSALNLEINVTLEISGTADGGSDYVALPSYIVLPAGVDRATLDVVPIDDSDDEPAETVNVTAVAGPGYIVGTPDNATVTIADDDLPEVTVMAVDDTASEPGTTDNGTFVFTRTAGDLTEDLVVSYVVSGNATPGADYEALPGTVTIEAGNTTASVNVTALDDAVDEAPEDVIATLADTPVGYVNGAADNASVAVIDDDAAPIVAFSNSATDADEGDGALELNVTLSAASALVVTIDYAATGGNATAGDDYTLAAGTLTFAPGETSQTISLDLIDDAIDEDLEAVEVMLSGAANATLGEDTHTVSIADNDEAPTVQFDVASSSVNESAGTVDVEVVLSAPSGRTVYVGYNVTAGSATVDEDFTAAEGTLAILPGQTSANITVDLLDDSDDEPSETVLLTLTEATNATLGATTTHTLTLLDDDAPVVTIAAGDDGAEPGTNGTVTVTRTPTGDLTEALDVSYAVGGNATADSDYTALSGTVTIPAGQSTATITVEVLDDLLDESEESVEITLDAGTGYEVGSADSAAVAIADDDDVPEVEFGADGSGTLESAGFHDVVVQLSAPSGKEVQVEYAVTGGTATGAGADYELADGTLTFAPGETSQTLNVTFIDDDLDEEHETVLLELSAPANATLGSRVNHTVVISDDDDSPTVAFAETTSDDQESDSTEDLEVTLTGSTALTVTVDYAITGGTATPGTDVVLANGTLTFAAGETSKTIEASIVDDLIDEANETFVVTLSNATNASLGANTTHTHTILDDDVPSSVVSIRASDRMAAEPGTDTATFQVTRSVADSGLPITVLYAVAGTATSGTDYVALSGTVDLAAGATTANVVLTALDDALSEDLETVIVTLEPSFGYTMGRTPSATATIRDDEPMPTVQLENATASIGEGDGEVVLNVTLSAPAGRDVTVKVGTRAGSAKTPLDFTGYSNLLVTFPAGTTSQQVAVTVSEDALDEANETFSVTLSAARNARLGVVKATTVTILDNDAEPEVQFALTSSDGPESGAALLTVSLSEASGKTVTVLYGADGGTATEGTDFTLRDGKLTFRPGEVTKTIRVSIRGDTLAEGDEDFTVSLSGPVNAILGANAVHTRTIIDND